MSEEIQIYELDPKGSLELTDMLATDDNTVQHVTRKVTGQQVVDLAKENITSQDGYDAGDGIINQSGTKPFTLNDNSATDTPDNSSLLEVLSTERGARPFPVMSAENRDDIVSPALGLGVFVDDDDPNRLYLYDGDVFQGVAYISDITAYLDTIDLQDAYDNGSDGVVLQTGTKPIVYKDSTATDTPSTKSLFDVLSTAKGARPLPRMTLTQFNAITSKPEALAAFLTDTTKPRPAVVSSGAVQQVAYLSDIPDYPPSLTLEQGQFPLGVTDDDPVPGVIESPDNSILVDTSEDGKIKLTQGPMGTQSLQGAYNVGNTIDLDSSKPLEVSHFDLGAATNAVVTPTGGTPTVATVYDNVAWEFTPQVDMVIPAVQYVDSEFTQPGTRQVSIFLKSSRQLLATDFVAKTDPLVGIYRTKELSSPLNLLTGVQYVLAVVVPPGEHVYTGPTPAAVPAAGITINGFSLGPGSAVPIPPSCPTIFTGLANITPAGFFQYQTFTANSRFTLAGDDTLSYFQKAESTTQGVIPAPLMTDTNINAIASPAEGLNAWSTTLKRPKLNDGTTWKTYLCADTVTASGITNPLTNDSINIANSGSLVEFQMPATAPVGSEIKIIGKGAGGWKVGCGGGQTIRIGTSVSISGGTLTGSSVGDCVILTCVTANTAWTGYGVEGSLVIDA